MNLQVGHGTAPVATLKNFQSGNLDKTDNPLDFAIDGDGFFTVLGPKGDIVYTRDGSFKISVSDNGNMLTTSDGSPVLDDSGVEIILDFDVSKLNVSSEGEMSYTDENGIVVPLGQRLGIVKFPNRNGLESVGNNFYSNNSASGEALPDDETGVRSNVMQYYLESSNVQVVE